MFSSDFIDITATSIIIKLSGGGTNMGGGYSNTGFDRFPGAFNLTLDIPNGVNVVLTDAIGLTDADVVFTANSPILNNLGNLGILGATVENQGQIAINFQFLREPSPSTPCQNQAAGFIEPRSGSIGIAPKQGVF